ncbi:MAG: hypothetical protein A3B71_08815 [Gammaproteobacteria bacterium RIFCSPHIGHO2_02_FULL_42_43]|nr:MAG: hypothetical protein A3B71_08815 [Gammaproteobacteria bacterium RIFCSPHIGHO2_02_FULL_42_43]
MKKIIAFCIVLMSFCVFAQAPFSTAPAPAQAYVSNLMPASSPAAAPPAPAAESSAVLDNHVALTSADTAEARLQLLESHDRDEISAIRAINQDIIVLQQQIQALHQQLLTNAAPTSTNSLLHWMRDAAPSGYTNMGVTIVLLLALSIIALRFFRRREKSVDASPEYDFMNTDEAIPAKLDLARSYLTMGNIEEARTLLAVVIAKGNSVQRNEAQQLMKQTL